MHRAVRESPQLMLVIMQEMWRADPIFTVTDNFTAD
jgi:hypothetical protein